MRSAHSADGFPQAYFLTVNPHLQTEALQTEAVQTEALQTEESVQAENFFLG